MKKYFVIMIALSFLVSCSDFLDIEMPKDQIFKETAFVEEKTATAVLANVYSSLRNEGFLSGDFRGIGFLMGCYTDELDATVVSDTDYKAFYNLSITPNIFAVSNLWASSYKQLYSLNNIIEGVEASSTLSEETKKQLKGEALALRALIHFYLTQTYGEVPYVTKSDYSQNIAVAKLSVDQVMQLSIQDLREAEELLSPNYPSSERVRINQSTVQALLARMYLYQDNWNLSYQYAVLVLSNTNYQLEDLNKLFLKESESTLWQLKSASDNVNTNEGMNYIYTAFPAPFAELSGPLLASFEVDDLRKDIWTKTIENVSTHAFKYKERGSSTPSKEYSVILRIEEVYLIAAEASAHLNDWEKFNHYINQIRTRAGLNRLNISNKEEAIKAVLAERRVEFFCEFGHRFYDLKRLKKTEILTAHKPNWSDVNKLLPLPETEILLNPKLSPQNPGY